MVGEGEQVSSRCKTLVDNLNVEENQIVHHTAVLQVIVSFTGTGKMQVNALN